MKYTPYLKKQAQLMRPYIVGEDVSKIGVPMGITPVEGGMVAHNPSNPDDQWYITPEFFKEHYQIAPMEHDDSIGQVEELTEERDKLFDAAIDDLQPILPCLTFGEAIKAVQSGFRCARKGWNGKGMWISMTEGKILDVNVHAIWTDNVRELAIENGGTVELLPYLSMKTADNKLQIGWLASQSDMLAEDWMVL